MVKRYQITNKISASTDYAGSVTICYATKDNGRIKIIKKHNKGMSGLFSFVSRSIAGLPCDKLRPISIMGFNNQNVPIFTQRITYASTPLLFLNDDEAVGNASNTVQYTFVIPFNNIKRGLGSIQKLVLYNSATSSTAGAYNEEATLEQDNSIDKCALVSLSSGEEINTDTGSAIIVYWKLKFENEVVENN